MASPDVFVDTSGLYALVDRRDPAHADARRTVERLVARRRGLILTEHIVAETVTLARVRGGAHVALRVLDLIDQTVAIRIEWVTQARFMAAKAFVRKHVDHGYSFVDCASFVVMREIGLTRALTTDEHFREAGFQPLLVPRRPR